MPRIPGLHRVFRLDVLAPRVEREVDEELAFHFDEKVAELVAGGLPPERARAEAERHFGDVARYRAELAAIGHATGRARRRLAALEAFGDDLRFTVRALRRRPGFVLAVVTTLALGIGANATMFGVVDRLLLRPPPHVAAPHELRHVVEHFPPSPDGSAPMGGFSAAVVRDLAAALDGLARVGAVAERPDPFGPGNMTLGVGDGALPVRGAVVTGSYLPLLGVRPVLGRVLLPADDTIAAAAPAAVIGHALWHRAFDGAPAVLGRPIRVDGAWYTVAGVLPPDFRGVEHAPPDVWLPLGPVLDARAAQAGGRRDGAPLFVVARPEGGVQRAAIESRASAVLAAEAAGRPVPRWRTGPPRAELLPLASLGGAGSRHPDVRVSLLLAGVSTFLLLVACASIANLLLARGLERGREIAVRLALGVSRRRLAAQLLTESILLALAGGIAALAVVQWGSALLQSLLLTALGATERPVDGRVLAFTAGVALLTGVLAGLLPALQASRPSLTGALRRGVQEGGGRRARTRTVLAGVQTALCVVLLVGTALFVRSLREAHAVPMGFDAARVVGARFEMDAGGYDRERLDAIFDRIAARAAALSGVRSVSVSVGLPLQVAGFDRVHVDGDTRADHPASPVVYRVSPGYLATLGTRLLRGRDLGAGDRDGAPLVALVSEAMAREYWAGSDPIGRCLRVRADTMPCTTVVGIVEDVVPMQATEELVRPQLYLPMAQSKGRLAMGRALLVRVAPEGRPHAVAAAVRGVMQEEAPGLRIEAAAPLADQLDREFRPWRLGATLFALFGGIALVVAAVGLYGVLAFGVAQRRHEMGVRLALGASGARVLALVVRQGLAVAAAGVAAGALLAAAGAPLVSDLLFRTSPFDPLVFAGVAATLLAVAVAASAVPAWRASRVPPADALRTE